MSTAAKRSPSNKLEALTQLLRRLSADQHSSSESSETASEKSLESPALRAAPDYLSREIKSESTNSAKENIESLHEVESHGSLLKSSLSSPSSDEFESDASEYIDAGDEADEFASIRRTSFDYPYKISSDESPPEAADSDDESSSNCVWNHARRKRGARYEKKPPTKRGARYERLSEGGSDERWYRAIMRSAREESRPRTSRARSPGSRTRKSQSEHRTFDFFNHPSWLSFTPEYEEQPRSPRADSPPTPLYSWDQPEIKVTASRNENRTPPRYCASNDLGCCTCAVCWTSSKDERQAQREQGHYHPHGSFFAKRRSERKSTASSTSTVLNQAVNSSPERLHVLGRWLDRFDGLYLWMEIVR